jgi:hypothetical protein
MSTLIQLSGGGSSATETVVNLSAAQILTTGSSPAVILPAPGANKYYAIYSVAMEFTDNGTPYTIGTGANPYIFINPNATANMFMQKGFLTTAGNKAMHFTHFEGALDTANSVNYQFSGTWIDKPVVLRTWGDVNPTLGNGTLRFVIKYDIRTFGA